MSDIFVLSVVTMRRHPPNTPSLLKHFGDDVSRVVAFTTTNTATIKEIFPLSFFYFFRSSLPPQGGHVLL